MVKTWPCSPGPVFLHERRDLFTHLFSITTIPWSAWSTVTTKRFNSREHTGLYTKIKLNWNLEWHFFKFEIPQNSFSYIWIFPTKVFPSISFLMRLVVPCLRFLNDWLIKSLMIQALYPHSLNVYNPCSLKGTFWYLHVEYDKLHKLLSHLVLWSFILCFSNDWVSKMLLPWG